MAFAVSIIALSIAGFTMASADPGKQEWGAGLIGTITGYWLKTLSDTDLRGPNSRSTRRRRV